jgi:hypothetical protein
MLGYITENIAIERAVFIFKKVAECRVTQIRSRGVVLSYTNARKKRFQSAVPACILKKNFWDGVPSQKYSWLLVYRIAASDSSRWTDTL